MSDSISRVLALVEAGSVTPAEAAALLRAIAEAGSAPEAGASGPALDGPPAPPVVVAGDASGSPADGDTGAPRGGLGAEVAGLLRSARDGVRMAVRRHNRDRWMWFHEWVVRDRSERAERAGLDGAARVDWILRHRLFLADVATAAGIRLRDDLGLDPRDFRALALALEVELARPVDGAAVEGCVTVGDLAALAQATPAAQCEPDAAGGRPEA